MILREDIENKERDTLSPYAACASQTRGRVYPEEKCRYRTDYQRDRDRIVHSKSFRRLMHKTQVFLAPEGDHFRTRLTHTLEVSQIARTIARALALNEDLAEAIALGHDLGHTPFGHNGEDFLAEIHPGGFRHNLQSLRVVEVLEGNKNYPGMNLTEEVRDGILNHTGGGIPVTMEGQVVKLSDRIAYINHDIDDAIRSGVIRREDLPARCLDILGQDHRSRINHLVGDVVSQSDGKNSIRQSPESKEAMNQLRTFMFEMVYHNSVVKKDEELDKVRQIIHRLYEYFLSRPEQLPEDSSRMIDRYGIHEIVKDYIAGMTDRYAMNLYDELFTPKPWKSF